MVVGLGLGTVSVLQAHGSDEHIQTADTVRGGTRAYPVSGAPATLDVKDALLAHPHNKLVHFPIAFALGALVLYLLAWVRGVPEDRGGDVLVLLGALATLVTVGAGWIQRTPFLDTPKALWMVRHQWLGFASFAGYAVWAGMVLRGAGLSKKVGMAWIMALLISVTAFLGGWVAHG